MPSTQVETAGTVPQNIVDQFEGMCAQQLDLCRHLEDIADSLGGEAERPHFKNVANEVLPIMLQAHDFEAEILFPALGLAASGLTGRRANAAKRSLRQLQAEHEDDICLVGEVVEVLLEFGKENSSVSPDAIGYLLRGLFVSLTRHLAYEKEVVRSLAPPN